MISLTDLKILLDALPYPIFGKNEQHVLIYGNSHFTDVMGRDDYVGHSDADFFSEEQCKVFRNEDQKVLNGQCSYNEERIGDTILAITSKFPVTLEDGSKGLVGIVLNLEDKDKNTQAPGAAEAHTAPLDEKRVLALETLLIETVRQKREALEQAMTDPATGARNRNGLDHDLEQAVLRYNEAHIPFALAFVDLDFFKRVNDRHGHDFGDQLLQITAKRLANANKYGAVARLGGDEFAVLLPLGLDETPETIQSRLDALQSAISQPVSIEDKIIHMTCSTGVALFPEHTGDLKHLKQNADAALLTSKAEGRDRLTLFSQGIREAADRRRLIEDGLHMAIASKSIEPHFQPIVCSKTEQILSVEVLARWEHPTLGRIAPDEFIALASDCGLLTKLDRVVFENGCKTLKDLLTSGTIQQASFNVSATDITDPRFAESLLTRTRMHGLDPSHICIEILETASIHDLNTAKSNLEILHNAGVCIALDDFGTGFSNLRSLLDLPLDRIKIDRSLIRDMESNQAVFDLFLTIVNLAGILGVTMVAEGLETDFNALMVASAGVTHLQGFYFAKPMTLADLESWIAERAPAQKQTNAA